MTSDRVESSTRTMPAVFLSYASEDRQSAQALRELLPTYGLEVWYDESDLHGGDAWDQKIRTQIRECDFFMPVISANTERRAERYFRREWRLAVERSLDIADDHVFLLPVVVDATVQADARVPERFLSVQWLRVPDGRPTLALEQLCRRLASGQATAPEVSRRARYQAPSVAEPGVPSRPYPPFPKQGAGTAHFFLRAIGWAFQSAWIFLRSLPKWARILVYVWVGMLLMSRGCIPHAQTHADDQDSAPPVLNPQPPKPPPQN